MIKISKDSATMVFGEGDICINPGRYIDNDAKVGFILFCNQEPRPIGSPGDVKAGTVVDINDFPVVMKFYRKESIDVVIKALNEARSLMLEDEGHV